MILDPCLMMAVPELPPAPFPADHISLKLPAVSVLTEKVKIQAAGVVADPLAHEDVTGGDTVAHVQRPDDVP